jgi:adenylate cyclase
LANSDKADTVSVLDEQFNQLISHAQQLKAMLLQNQSVTLPSGVLENIDQLVNNLGNLDKQVHSLEDERVSLRALARIGGVINSSLEIDEVLQAVMDTIIRLTHAERGFLMLKQVDGELSIRTGRNWEMESLDPSEFAISHTIIYRVINEGQPVLTTNAQEDPRFTGQESIIAYNLRSILCVPLKVKANLIGVIYADNRIRSGLFTHRELEILTAFADQAAVALENARLFASVRQSLAEVTALKNLMDNVFSSIASGVLTADVQERILMCNRSAELILGQTSLDLVGREITQILSPLASALSPYFSQVLENDQAILGLEANPILESRGQVNLRLNLSPLKDETQNTQGVTIVMEDLTEKKKLEAQRRLFERMVSPRVIEQLDPDRIKLGGQRAEITILFADIRGFTSFSETVSPEQLVAVLNDYLALAAEEILKEEGTIDKFLGDAVMAWFNAPIVQADHTLRAVRAALRIQNRLTALHLRLPTSAHLSFGVGIHVGEAVLGMVGTERRLDFTAIGDSVNTAKRIQENSAAGQILISQTAMKCVSGQVQAVPVEPIQAKGKRDPIAVYQINSLL